VRINKYLASIGIASRRSVDELVAAGKIKVNGKVISQGYKLNAGDVIEYQAKKYNYGEQPELVYVALYKPQGISSTCAEDDPDNIIDFLRVIARHVVPKQPQCFAKIDGLLRFTRNDEARLFPVGRLDKYSEGLIILTNDGELTNILTHPSYEHEKEYQVELKNDISNEFLQKFSAGIEIELEDNTRVRTKPCKVQRLSARKFKVILKQGLNRQIRRMADALANPVSRLIRLRVAKLELGMLKPGEFKLVNYDDII